MNNLSNLSKREHSNNIERRTRRKIKVSNKKKRQRKERRGSLSRNGQREGNTQRDKIMRTKKKESSIHFTRNISMVIGREIDLRFM
jgi:hypothetical protein